MSDCELFQRIIASEPDSEAALHAHLKSCSECAAVAAQSARLDRVLADATQLKTPPQLVESLRQLPWQQRRRSVRRWLPALAAAVVLAVGLGGMFYFTARLVDVGLETVVYQHIVNEPEALRAVGPADEVVLQALLAGFGMNLKAPLGRITHVTLCPIGDGHGLHLVVRGRQGRPVTLLFIPGPSPRYRIRFAQGSLAGYIDPVPAGALAVVGAHGQSLARMDSLIKASLVWL